VNRGAATPCATEIKPFGNTLPALASRGARKTAPDALDLGRVTRKRKSMDDLLREFLTETAESLDAVDRELVRFEKEPNDTKSLDTIFRLVHTIKGACGFLGLPRLAALTHAAETLLGGFPNGSAVTVEAVNLILASIDRIKALLDALERNGIEPDGNDRDLIGELEALDKDWENPSPAPERTSRRQRQ
jgi:two-component system chemotaxis sensor kinase CheA